MTDEQYEEIGFMKFSGKAVEAGIINAGSAGAALTGLDEVIRFFNEKQSSQLAKTEYQIPVRTTEGSWVAVILGAVGVGAATFSLSYIKKAGEKMAEKDFDNIGLKDVTKKSIDAIQHLISLVKHTGITRSWDLKNVLWNKDRSEIGILNHQNEPIYIPIQYIQWYNSLPFRLISKITREVDIDRSLSIGLKKNNEYYIVTVKNSEKLLFVDEDFEFEEDYLFPELHHGDSIRIEGKLTRGNASSNSIGVEYQGHILNCVPEQGSIRRFKPALFLKCIVDGTVNRHTKGRMVADKRPTIVIRSVVPLEADEQNQLLDL